MDRQLSLADESEEYQAFVEKFKPKKTTDDCYTPQPIYDLIADYVVERYGIDRDKIVRPFWPGGDYQREEYPDGCTVVDNPPFSILSQIIDYYMRGGVRFFLFAPTLTAIAGRGWFKQTNHLILHTHITYENGAKVNTSFITNLETDGTVVESCPELSDAINAKDDELRKEQTRTVGNYAYPDAVLTAAKVGWFCAHHTPYRLHGSECVQISKLDNQPKGIFGGGLLLSERAAAERAAAERAAAERAAAEKIVLTERELKMQRMIG